MLPLPEEKRFEEVVKDKKEADLSAEEKTMREDLSKKVVTLRDERNERLKEIGGSQRSRASDYRPRAAVQRHAERQEPFRFHPTLDFAYRERKEIG